MFIITLVNESKKIYSSTNFILIGFMGCGKSSVGKVLSNELGYTFYDTDEMIEQGIQKSITRIFEEDGEDFFRTAESNVIGKLFHSNCCIISTGGGILKNINNYNILNQLGYIIYLKSTPEQIYQNIHNSADRPLLNNIDNKLELIRKLYTERAPSYQNACDAIVETTNFSIQHISSQLLEFICANKKI